MKSVKQVVITKRDGTLERFSQTKLGNCLAQVLRKNAYDPRLSGPLVKAVAMHLGEWRQPRPATTDYIHGCVRAVLKETGLGEVADELAAHRRQRRARRGQIRVADEDVARSSGRLWNKAALVVTLENKHGLRHAVARYLAGRIELQVFALQYRLVTRAFLRELVRNELLAWGLADEQTLTATAPALPPPAGARQPDSED